MTNSTDPAAHIGVPAVYSTPEGSQRLAGGERSDTPGFVVHCSVSTPEGSQRHDGQASRACHRYPRVVRTPSLEWDARWHPSRVQLYFRFPTGGVAPLNPRLMAGTLPGCTTSRQRRHRSFEG